MYIDIKHIKSTYDRVASYIAITKEYGRPSEDYIDTFIFNFNSMIASFSNKAMLDFLDKGLEEGRWANTGGREFFLELSKSGINTEEQLRNFIENYTSRSTKLRELIAKLKVLYTDTEDETYSDVSKMHRLHQHDFELKHTTKEKFILNIGNKNIYLCETDNITIGYGTDKRKCFNIIFKVIKQLNTEFNGEYTEYSKISDETFILEQDIDKILKTGSLKLEDLQ